MKILIGFLIGILLAVLYLTTQFDLIFYVCNKGISDFRYAHCQETPHAFIYRDALVFIEWNIEEQRYTNDIWYFAKDSEIRWTLIHKPN